HPVRIPVPLGWACRNRKAKTVHAARQRPRKPAHGCRIRGVLRGHQASARRARPHAITTVHPMDVRERLTDEICNKRRVTTLKPPALVGGSFFAAGEEQRHAAPTEEQE